MKATFWIAAGLVATTLCGCNNGKSSLGPSAETSDSTTQDGKISNDVADFSDVSGQDGEPAAPDDLPGKDDEGIEKSDSFEWPEVDWTALPRLPPNKTFQTRYAAAAARRDITPDHPIYLGGFGFCGGNAALCRKSEGVHDPLYVTAVALADTKSGEVVIFAGVDSVGIFLYDTRIMHDMIQLRLYEEQGVFFEGPRLMIGASHAHSTPDTTGLWGPMFGYGRDEAYMDFLRRQIVDAAVEAFTSLDDVILTWGQGSSVNYTDGTEPVVQDQDLFVLRGVRPDQTPVFTFTRWSSHPTAYGSKNNGISSDWVGPFRKRMEAELGGLALFMNGCLGGTYPDRPSECGLEEEAFPDGWKDPDLKPEDFMRTTCTGYQVADHAIQAMQSARPLAEDGIEFRHTTFGFYPENATLLFAAKVAQAPFAWGDPEALLSDNPPDMYTEFSVARVGDLTFLTTPGEAFPAFGASAKEVLTQAGLPNPVILGLTQDWLGYLLTEDQWKDPKLSYHQGLSPGRKVQSAYLAALKSLISGLK